jgi:hypothetical protein
MSVRAKFKVQKHTETKWGALEGQSTIEVEMGAVYGKDGTENATWSKATPMGTIKMTITNLDAVAQLEIGKEFYVDFTPADEAKPQV